MSSSFRWPLPSPAHPHNNGCCRCCHTRPGTPTTPGKTTASAHDLSAAKLQLKSLWTSQRYTEPQPSFCFSRWGHVTGNESPNPAIVRVQKSHRIDKWTPDAWLCLPRRQKYWLSRLIFGRRRGGFTHSELPCMWLNVPLYLFTLHCQQWSHKVRDI